jgi:hypothetical protein
MQMTRGFLVACLSLAWLSAAGSAVAQSPDARATELRSRLTSPPEVNLPSLARGSDPVWEGLLIGGAIGVVGGMVVAPPLFCGNNDAECTAIVRVAVGLPIVAGCSIAGALIDRCHQRGHLVWTSRSGRRGARLDPLFVRARGRRPALDSVSVRSFPFLTACNPPVRVESRSPEWLPWRAVVGTANEH